MYNKYDDFIRFKKIWNEKIEVEQTFGSQHRISAYSNKQNCTIKCNFRAPQYLKQHIDYITRDGASDKNKLFDRNGETTKKEAGKKLKNEKRHFRIIISPENGHKMNMQKYVQNTMEAYEKELNVELRWSAIVHTNTNNIHAHVVILLC